MPDDDNTPNGQDSEQEYPAEGTVVDGESSEDAEGREDTQIDWEERYKNLQSAYTQTTQKLADLAIKQASSATPPSNNTEGLEDINAIAEQIAKSKGAGAAIQQIAMFQAQQMVAPLAQRLQQLEVEAANPENAKLRPRVQGILSDVESGKVNIDTLLYRTAAAEDALDKLKKGGGVPRRPDKPGRGVTIGSRGQSRAPEPVDPSTASEAEIDRAVFEGLTDPAAREQFLEKHPHLQGKRG